MNCCSQCRLMINVAYLADGQPVCATCVDMHEAIVYHPLGVVRAWFAAAQRDYWQELRQIKEREDDVA